MQLSKSNQIFNFIYHNYKLKGKKRENLIQFLLQNFPQLNISNFNKLGIVGEGPLSKVHMTQEINSSKVYAAKSFFLNNFQFFFNQLNILQQISHPNIQKCIGYSLYDINNKFNPTIYTEYYNNGSLKDILEQERRGKLVYFWNESMKLSIIYNVACAMSYLHLKGVIHRDLKPSNILLDSNFRPILTDFGCAIHIDSNKKEDKDSFFGTPLYLAPEIWKGNKYSTKSDVFAFGLIMYEILIGSLPLAYSDSCQICYRVAFKNEKPPISDQMPDFYKEIINSCLSSDPNQRPSFDEIINKLRNNEDFNTYYINKIIDKFKFDNRIICLGDTGSGKSSFSCILNQEKQVKIGDKGILKQNFKPCVENKKFIYCDCPSFIDSDDLSSIEIELAKDYLNKLNIKEINLNNYEKLRKIGSGGFGQVYLIRHKSSKQLFAAKMFLSNKYKNQMNEFIHELTINSEIKHPSITRLIGYSFHDFENEPRMIIITEYVKNGSLERILRNERNNIIPKGWNKTMKLITIYGIASAISYLHSKGILHLDIKPENILINEFFLSKICDFGISMKIDSDQLIRSETIGTFRYMSPEIIKHNKITTKSDVYSFGILLYEIISNNYPYEGCSPYNIIYQITHGIKPKLNNSIPKIYRKLIQSCLNDDPNNRPSFENILNDLRSNKKYIIDDIDELLYSSFIDYIDEELKGNNVTSKRIKLFEKYNLDDFYKNVFHYESSNSYTSYYTNTSTNRTNQLISTQLLKNEIDNKKNNSYAFFNNKMHNHYGNNNNINCTIQWITMMIRKREIWNY